jgi:hypothetical protein
MNRYCYFFSYETPQQLSANAQHGWDDENCQMVCVLATSEVEALSWGQEVAEAFYAKLHKHPTRSWRSIGYADGIDNSLLATATDEAARDIPVVRVGEHPSWAT